MNWRTFLVSSAIIAIAAACRSVHAVAKVFRIGGLTRKRALRLLEKS